MGVAEVLAAWVTAIATGIVAIAAWVQLPLISKQVSGLAEQIRLSRESEANAERRIREWETLKACERYDFDPILEAATHRIWVASENGTNYQNPNLDKRDVVCLVNYLDGLTTGMEQGLYIEEVIKDHLSPIFKHAVENLVHTKFMDANGIEKVVATYDRWFHPRTATDYRSGGAAKNR